MALEKTRIQKALIELGQRGEFYPVTYDTETKLPRVDLGKPLSPSQVLCNETKAGFGVPRRNRQTGRRERLSWLFELVLGFDQEVTFEAFEDALCETPTVLPRDIANGHTQQVTLDLVEAPKYVHPYQQESSAGSRVSLVFDARLSPV